MTTVFKCYSRPVKLFLLLVGAVVFLLSLFTVWRMDAINYQYITVPETAPEYLKQPIENFADIWQSQTIHYQIINGRFVVHCIVELFCAILGRGWFAFFNACMWMILPVILLNLAGDKKPSLRSIISATALGAIVFFRLRFDPPMHINYVWMGVAILLWLKLFLSEKSSAWWQIILLAIYSFLVGEGNESFSAPVAAGIICFFIWRRGKFSAKQWIMALAFAVGSIVLVMAPGLWVRAAAEDTPHSLSHLIRGIAQILAIPILAGVSLFPRKTIKKSVLTRGNLVFVLSTTIASYLLAIYLYRAAIDRVAICGSLFLTVVLLSKLRDFSYRRGALAAVSLLAMFLLSTTIYDTWRCNRVEEDIYDAYGKSADGMAYIPNEVFGYQSREMCISQPFHAAMAKRLHPGKPDALVRPAAMRSLPLDKDTNLVVKIAPQTWLMLRSKTRPATFIVNKLLLPGIVNAPMAPRELDFGERTDVVFEESALWQAAVYNNARPFLEADVTMVLPR